jgi:hypothetical protein
MQNLMDGLRGDLRKMAGVWKLFVEGCFSGKIRGIGMADAVTTQYVNHVGSETEALIRLELIKRFEEQGFCWAKGNDGRKNQRYTDFRLMQGKVVLA